MDLQEVKRLLPEYKQILELSGGHKPRKFIEKIKIIKTPATYNPSGLGDAAYRFSYYVDKYGKITPGPSYSYESMMAVGVKPVERTVDIPEGTRLWIVTWDGMWGGNWTVEVFVHGDLLTTSVTEKQTDQQKYNKYINALIERPDIVAYLKQKIEESPNKEIIVKAIDVARELGPYFENLRETDLFLGLTYSLFTHGIVVSTTTGKDINPKTGRGCYLLRMRIAKPGDKLSTKYFDNQ